MYLATYIDGDEKTPYGVLLAHHTTSVKVKIKPEHVQAWIELLSDHVDEGVTVVPATDRSLAVPFTISTAELGDVVSDVQDEPWCAPYAKDLRYMCEEDPVGMGVVYLVSKP